MHTLRAELQWRCCCCCSVVVMTAARNALWYCDAFVDVCCLHACVVLLERLYVRRSVDTAPGFTAERNCGICSNSRAAVVLVSTNIVYRVITLHTAAYRCDIVSVYTHGAPLDYHVRVLCLFAHG